MNSIRQWLRLHCFALLSFQCVLFFFIFSINYFLRLILKDRLLSCLLREDKFHLHVEAVNDDEETLTLSGGLVSPALWPSRIWSCTEL